jgi:hypothetical protein
VHDYAALYRTPGLYETLVNHKFVCNTPARLVALLTSVLDGWRTKSADLRVLDFGAGNGVVAGQLRAIGVQHIVGLDIYAEARRAANRDRPGVYDDYVVGPITEFSDVRRTALKAARFNCLIAGAGREFGELCPEAFRAALDLVEDGGLVAFATQGTLFGSGYDSALSARVRLMVDVGAVSIEAFHRYCRLRSAEGSLLFQTAAVCRKLRSLTRDEFGHPAPAEHPPLPSRARGQQTANSGAGRTLTLGQITVDVPTETVSVGGHLVPLSRHQRLIIKRLALTPGEVVSPNELCSFAQIRESPNNQNLQNEMHRLRRRLGAEGSKLLRNRRGEGYRLVMDGS